MPGGPEVADARGYHSHQVDPGQRLCRAVGENVALGIRPVERLGQDELTAVLSHPELVDARSGWVLGDSFMSILSLITAFLLTVACNVFVRLAR